MGIDAQAYSKEFPKQFLGRPAGRKALVAINKRAKSWSAQKGLAIFYQSQFISNSKLEILIHPLADPIEFQSTHRGIGVGFRSSNGGPGFHAAAIELLDQISEQEQIAWTWGEPGAVCTDETDYAERRDFDDLQRQLADFLYSLMESVLDQETVQGSLCLPWGLGNDVEGLCCPLGIQPPTWPNYVVGATEEDRLRIASKFYPWWEQQTGALFWEGMLRGLLWQQIIWRAPVEDQEHRVLKMVRYAARNLQMANGCLPDDLTKALGELDQAVSDDIRPADIGIGYRRQNMTVMPHDDWQITLPGCLFEHDPDEDHTVRFNDDQINLYISAHYLQRTDNKPFDWIDSLNHAVQVDEYELSRRVGEPVFNREEGIVTQSAMVLHDDDVSVQLLTLTLTLAVSEVKELDEFETWLSSIRFHRD